MKIINYLEIILAIALSFGLTACSGGGGGDSSSPSIGTITGTFVDDPVEGLDYNCSSGRSGTTNPVGQYTCNIGDDVTFRLGNILLGTIAAQNAPITPYMLFPTDTTAAINLARVLQSMNTRSNTGVIDLNTTLVDLLPANTDFSSASFETATETALGITLVSAYEAQSTMDTGITNAGGTPPTDRNLVPVANAGADQNVNTTATVTLDGSASSDSNEDSLTYKWSFSSKPLNSTTTLSNDTSANPSFIADVDGSYVVELIVNDGEINSAVDTVTVNASTEHTKPIVTDLPTPPAVPAL